MILISCLNPLVAYPSGYTENGKLKYMPVPRSTQIPVEQLIKEGFFNKPKEERPILVPCGHCLGCRLDYSREWAARCMLELKSHDSAYFVTLTYSDSEVPRTYFSDPETGEALPALTLRKRHFQLFMKMLRKKFPDDKIRFYACGEYGSDTLRPHYHAIIFGLHLVDKKLYKRTDTGLLYNSEKLSSCWFRYDAENKLHFPRGYVVVADVNWDTCAYVARYTAKKSMTVGDDFFESFNLESPFVLMSRRPGIGRKYLDEHPDLFDSSKLFFPKGDGVTGVSIPRYFFKVLEQSDSELCADLRQKRQLTGNVYTRSQLAASKRSYDDILEDSKALLIQRAKSLTRDI